MTTREQRREGEPSTAETPATANRPRRPMWSCSTESSSSRHFVLRWQMTPLVIPSMIAARLPAVSV